MLFCNPFSHLCVYIFGLCAFCHICICAAGIVWVNVAGIERPTRVPAVLPYGGTGLIAQCCTHRFYSSLWLGHGNHVFTERGNSFVGCKRFGDRAGECKHIVYGNNHICRDGFSKSIKDVKGRSHMMRLVYTRSLDIGQILLKKYLKYIWIKYLFISTKNISCIQNLFNKVFKIHIMK